jgi:hypothetical protein
VEEVLEIRVADHGVEALVRERELRRVQIDVMGLDAAPRGALGADPRDVGADHVRALVLQELREEAGTAAGLEDALARLHARDDHLEALVVDLALGEVGPMLVVVVAEIHRTLPDQRPAAVWSADRPARRHVWMTPPVFASPRP